MTTARADFSSPEFLANPYPVYRFFRGLRALPVEF
jgi:hypothetical protein